jgi:hypothetical protein
MRCIHHRRRHEYPHTLTHQRRGRVEPQQEVLVGPVGNEQRRAREGHEQGQARGIQQRHEHLHGTLHTAESMAASIRCDERKDDKEGTLKSLRDRSWIIDRLGGCMHERMHE